MRLAAFTIVSRNYISFAKTLCESFLAHHPESTFYVILVDEIDDFGLVESSRYQLIPMADLSLPGADLFPFKYSILELNTAVKPFAYRHIFERFSVDALLYIDPDIRIFEYLTHVWEALSHSEVVLTPHMFVPLEDSKSPSELNILQSGTYNLGFLGLRRGETSEKLLKWWSRKLFSECVVDIPRGLFVDQKWMDLVPAYFENVHILRHPGYNVAYWNLHERYISQDGDKFLCNGEPLYFFHFSGFKPESPDIISKHQNRHEFWHFEAALKNLFDSYKGRLERNFYYDTKDLKFAFSELKNSVKITPYITACVRALLSVGQKIPSPITQPHEFCTVLALPNAKLFHNDSPLLLNIIWHSREDVRNTFKQFESPGFIQWFETSGSSETETEWLLPTVNQISEGFRNPITTIVNAYQTRDDLQASYPCAMSNRAMFVRLVQWLHAYGIKELDITLSDIILLENAHKEAASVMQFYRRRADVQSAFWPLWDLSVANSFAAWLERDSGQPFSAHAIEVFRAALTEQDNLDELKWFCLQHTQRGRLVFDAPLSVLEGERIDQLAGDNTFAMGKNFLATRLKEQALELGVHRGYVSELAYTARRVYERYKVKPALQATTPQGWISDLQRFEVKIRNKDLDFLESELSGQPFEKGVNVFGFFDSPTGMGESSRSLIRILNELGVPYTKTNLPNFFSEETYLEKPQLALLNPWVGGYSNAYDVNIVVANADCTDMLDLIAPAQFWERSHNIGFWVWETETLPKRFRGASLNYDEIWTPSQFSKRAIEASVDCPVYCVPHSLDLEGLASAEGDRERFGIAGDAFVFGYFFDTKSALRRKNPGMLLSAFKAAFPDRGDVQLVLKVSSPTDNDYEFELLKSDAVSSPNVVWIERQMTDDEVKSLNKSLDAYVSPHRAEGFGLTLAESMAIGIPTIASAYSGNVDFQNSSNCLLIEVEPARVGQGDGPYEAHELWCEPCEGSLMNALRTLVNDRERGLEIAQEGQQAVFTMLNPAVLARQVRKLLENHLEVAKCGASTN